MNANLIGGAGMCRLWPLVALGILLTACGGGGGSGGDLATYTVSASAGVGGAISPTSTDVNAGATAAFSVTPGSGYGIASVGGCGGSLSGTIYTTGPVNADCSIEASFAALPVVNVGNAAIAETDSGTASLGFTVTLSAAANGYVTVDYVTSANSAISGASCTVGVDYLATSGTLTIAGGSTTGTISVTNCGDITPEADETFSVMLSGVSANALLGTDTATGTLTNDDAYGRLNDTGITACGDYAALSSGTHNNNVDCAAAAANSDTEIADGNDPVPAGQDALFGRDANPLTDDATDGHAGFSFTKLGSDGRPLADQSAAYATIPWPCVLDNVTGLMWEVKTADGGLHDKDWRYYWYNPDASTNGGHPGVEMGGDGCAGTGCDTANFIAAVNAAGLCGHADWRQPSAGELATLLNNGIASPGPIIDGAWFPNTASWYWSSTPYAGDPVYAWYVDFNAGAVAYSNKLNVNSIRLVRAEQ